MSDAERVLRVQLRARPAPDAGPWISASFEVPPGVSALLGPSGAGKSTCMRALAGLVSTVSGRISVGERVLFDSDAGIALPPEARRIALVFQSLALFPHLSALQNVMYGVSRNLGRHQRQAHARAWLARMHAEHLAAQKPPTLSGGEAQRVALARALASEPDVLLLDEPLSALDRTLRQQLMTELRQAIDARPIPTLLVTHDLEDAQRLAQRVVQLG